MSRFASSLARDPVPASAVGGAAGEIMEALGGEEPDLVVCFASPHFVGAFDDTVAALRDLLGPSVFLAVTAVSIVGGAHEIEDAPALSVFAAHLPDARLTPVSLEVHDTPDGRSIIGWPDLDHDPSTLLLLADPYTFPVDGFLRTVDDEQPGLRVIGGMASAARRPGGDRLALDDAVTSTGAVGVIVDGVPVRTVVSQGCRPVGDPFVVTAAERNFVEELGGQPAIDRLQQCAARASDDDRALMQRGLHIGLVVDEHKAEFQRGDFLVRNVIGADERSGAIAIGELVTVGQTAQFHVRDAAAADEDLRGLLTGVDADAALLFTCNGRGVALFGTPDHDAGIVDELLGRVPIAGAFCAGEIGPVGNRNFLHGFTASLALF
jgi:small ligand-binding sensory domain FIST